MYWILVWKKNKPERKSRAAFCLEMWELTSKIARHLQISEKAREN